MVKNLKKLREERGLSQQKLAEQFGLSQQSIYKYENNLAEPDIDMLIRFAEFFYTSVDFLVGHVDEEDLQSVEPLTNSEIHHIRMYRRLSKVLQRNINSIIEEIVEDK